MIMKIGFDLLLDLFFKGMPDIVLLYQWNVRLDLIINLLAIRTVFYLKLEACGVC